MTKQTELLQSITDHSPMPEQKSKFPCEALLQQVGVDVCRFITQNISPYAGNAHIIPSNESDNAFEWHAKQVQVLIDLHPLDASEQYLYHLNCGLPDSGMYIGCCLIDETDTIMPRKPGFANNQRYPNTPRYARAEALGRIAQAGFELIEHRFINGLLYYCAMKTSEAQLCDDKHGWVIGLQRIGLHKQVVKVYKLRTMHPFSEYLQDYVVKLNGYNAAGKPANDFRLVRWGRFFRKYWLDELPQLINVLKGELAIVGVRPLSSARFKELPRDVQEQRVKFKPGCIPPYVALNMPDSEGNIEAERIYMAEKSKSPFLTDVRYFFMAVSNILRGKIKSA
ncbi:MULTISPECIES: sugar transferase [unclassified Carboxylicivirga]|uniref:sugar transferase n=1 Tax=Carboxylicivirga TaxID=1628153 RepID=UPI003D34758C